MYRLTLHAADGRRLQVHLGESQDMRRRPTGNYRNPGPGQATSQRISETLTCHLRAGGRVGLDAAYAATVTADESAGRGPSTVLAGQIVRGGLLALDRPRADNE